MTVGGFALGVVFMPGLAPGLTVVSRTFESRAGEMLGHIAFDHRVKSAEQD